MLEYSTFTHALVATMLFTVGRASTEDLMWYNSIWGVLYVVFFFFFVVYFLLTVFMGIYSEAYRLTMITQGHPDDLAPDTKWKFKDFCAWSLSYCPKSLLLKLKVKKEIEDDDDDEDEKKKDDINEKNK